jgi:hypothetical protein
LGIYIFSAPIFTTCIFYLDGAGGVMMKHDGGKGDAPRPLGIPMEEFDKNFESIFGKKTPKEQYEEKKAAVLHDPREGKKDE